MLGTAAFLASIHYLRVWTAESGAAASADSRMAWLLLIVSLVVLEAFAIILIITHFISIIVITLETKANLTGATSSTRTR
jgi:hypothetical protein